MILTYFFHDIFMQNNSFKQFLMIPMKNFFSGFIIFFEIKREKMKRKRFTTFSR